MDGRRPCSSNRVFSRVSDNGRLTLVIDERHGVDEPTSYALSALDHLDEAVTDLQKREGCPRNRIGFIDVKRDLTCDRALTNHPVACARIRIWAKDRHVDAVVWTAIGPRFQEKTGVLFSVDAAVHYLAGLQGPTRDASSGLPSQGAVGRGHPGPEQGGRCI